MKTDSIKHLKKNLPLFAALFLLGIIFLCFSEYNENTKGNLSDEFDAEAYTEKMELRLEEMIGKMDGISDVNVMIALEGGLRYQWAKETSKNLEGEKNYSSSTLLLLESTGGNSSPILVEKSAPKIRGVSVVCKGAKSAQAKERIIGLVAGTLNLNANQIYVTE